MCLEGGTRFGVIEVEEGGYVECCSGELGKLGGEVEVVNLFDWREYIKRGWVVFVVGLG